MRKIKFLSVFLSLIITLGCFSAVEGIQKKPLKINKIKFDTAALLRQKNKVIDQIQSAPFPYNDYIITLKNGSSLNNITDNKKHNMKITSKNTNSYILTSDKKSILELLKNDNVLSAEFDTAVKANGVELTEETPPEDYAWNIKMVNANIATPVNNIVKIAIIDSGVSPHLDLNIQAHIDFTNDSACIPILNDNSGHGTGIAGIINCQNDNQGYIGINPTAELYSLKVLDSNNTAQISTIIEAIEWCINNNIDIINMSFGTDIDSIALHHIINKAYQNDIIMVASSGNSGTIQYPAQYDEVISVGSVDSNGNLSDFSAISDIMAPGESVCSTSFFEGYSAFNGTSYSAAHVTGAVSKILAMDNTKPVEFIRNLLKSCASNKAGINILNLRNCFDNFADFNEMYTYDSTITYLQETEKDYSYDVSNIVVGSWEGAKHSSMVDDTDSAYLLSILNLSEEHLDLLKECSKLPDSSSITFEVNGETTTYKDCLGLHGYHKYVSNLNYIYTIAYNYLARNTFESGDARIDHPIATVPTDNVSTGVKQAVLNLVNSSVLPDFAETNHITKAVKILGFALHLAGDIHAHRTRVPTTTVSASNQTQSNKVDLSHFNAGGSCPNLNNTALLKSNAKTSSNLADAHTCYDCFKKTVNNYWMEFRDIKYYVKPIYRSNAHELYVDNINYYSSRFNHGTAVLVKLLTNNLLTCKEFNVKWMFHSLYSSSYDNGYDYTIKLNNLVNYCKQVDSSITYTDEMKSNSTNDYI